VGISGDSWIRSFRESAICTFPKLSVVVCSGSDRPAVVAGPPTPTVVNPPPVPATVAICEVVKLTSRTTSLPLSEAYPRRSPAGRLGDVEQGRGGHPAGAAVDARRRRVLSPARRLAGRAE
jgi:hypothetical protein